jgi:hypothetical protein
VWDAADKLKTASDWDQDCVSVLCTLSGVGTWEIADNGRMIYRAPCNDYDDSTLTETGVHPVEVYGPGDEAIPTRVAQTFGLGEVVVCQNAGDFLQGDTIIARRVHRITQDESGSHTISETTLRDILGEDGDGDYWWKPLEWRHLQLVVDPDGGQQDRLILLSEILYRIASAEMDAETFIPYGHQFADSDFIDAI